MGTREGTKRIAYFFEGYINALGDVLGYVFEVSGYGLFDMFSWLGDKVSFRFPFLWLGSVVKGLLCLVSIGVKIPFGIAGGIVSGAMKTVVGLFWFDWLVLLDAIQDILSPIFGAIILFLGKLIALVQAVFYLQGFERRLIDVEIEQLKKVFAPSIQLFAIRVIDGSAGLFVVSPRAFTLGNTIYLKSKSYSIDLLIHETTHAWQYQKMGCRYASDAIIAQWFVDDAYNWKMEINTRGKKAWIDMNKEAQAEFIQDLWKWGKLCDNENNIIKVDDGAYFEADDKKTFGKFILGLNDYSCFSANAVRQLQKRWF